MLFNVFLLCWYIFAVIDAWGKIPAGILSGNLYSLGQFDECLAVQHELQAADASSSTIRTQYCLAEMYTKTVGMPATRVLKNPIKSKGIDTRMLGFQNENKNET